jgi:hypothetical protein
MSTRSLRRGLPALLVILATACIDLPAVPSTPPPSTPSGPPEIWEGTARYSVSSPDRLYPEYPPTVTTFETTVTWKRNPNPVEPLPAGAVAYVASGHLRLTYTGGPCLVHGDVERDWAYQPPSDYNTLVVKADGSYYGSVYQFVSFNGTQSNCTGRKDRQFESTMALIFNGSLANGRAQGTQVETLAGDTATGAWDFGAR